ncbi:NACHT domain-containing protein [Acinetobacter junii]|uniref:NACHT domain-containing protein n=1 Tax=Acinetobacter junii TaxID=40215 RepID=UPI00125FD120|nr:ATP-binding protein [Acinetobacter junii]
MNDLGVTIKHSKKDFITVDDIFVYPDIKCVDDNLTIKKYKWTVNEVLDKYNYIYFLGSEESGKTTLMKRLAKDYLSQGYSPIVVNAENLKNIDEKQILQDFNERFGLSFSIDSSKTILLIDNFSKQRLKDNVLDKFLSEITEKFFKVFIFVDKNNFFMNSNKYLKYKFKEVEILNFGYAKRNELYKRWYSVGEDIDVLKTDNEMYGKIDALANHFDILMKKNIMDSRPIYILTIIQTLENMSTNNNYQLTSYGQCYYVLLTGMLKKANISLTNDLDGFLNFLSFLAYYLYAHNLESICDEELNQIIVEYSSKYIAPRDIKKVLLNSGVFVTPDDDSMRFSQKYLYYFCCAKHLADNAIELADEITLLCKNMHNENKANILIFLVHHLRSTNILQEILNHAICLMDGISVFDMNLEQCKEFKGLLGEEIHKVVYEDKNSEEQRELYYRNKEKIEDSNENSDLFDLSVDEKELDIKKSELEAKVDFSLFQQATSSIRSIEVLGQIAKNRHSSINRNDLSDILMVAYDNGLKVLNFYLNIFKDTENDLKEFIKSIVSDKGEISTEEAKKVAEKIIHQICFSICMYIIQLISKSTAHSQLLEISEKLTEQRDTPAYFLVDLYSRLIIQKELPKSLIKKIKKENENNPLVYSLLKQLVVGHLYLHNVDYREKQWIQDNINVKVADQLRATSNQALKQLN